MRTDDQSLKRVLLVIMPFEDKLVYTCSREAHDLLRRLTRQWGIEDNW